MPSDGAKRTTVYAALGLRKGVSELLWAYRKKYSLEEFPAYLDDHPLPILTRVEQEIKNDMKTADIVIAPHYLLLMMKKRGLLGTYRSAELSAFPPWAQDASWVGIGVTTMFPAYNTSLARGTLPKDFDDLFRRYSKKDIASQAFTTSSAGNLTTLYFAALRRVVGDRVWESMMDKISGEKQPETYDCIDHLLQAVARGDHSVAMTVYSLAYERMREEKAPISQLAIPELPVLWTLTSVGLIKGAENRLPPRHFIDFLLSGGGQQKLGKIRGITPSRSDLLQGSGLSLDPSRFFPLATEVDQMPNMTKKLARMGLK